MKIIKINTIKYNNNQQYHIQNTAQSYSQEAKSGVYSPIFYQDYNLKLSFGKRSPEDFYSQDFNRENMPVTMKKYLYSKFEERRKVAPVQIMQEAFDNLNGAETVDKIKENFPNEPKFEKLRPANYSKATTGVLRKIRDIKEMQEIPEPLFKDGTDDLTTYLVKKIYLEGKTVNEIDKDFAKDINPIYELAARVPDETARTLGKGESAYFSRSTIYNLGIRFPETPFWNSFIATRDDYERTRRIKSSTGEFVNADSPEGKAILAQRNAAREPKPNKYNFDRKYINRITDGIVNAKGETRKALKHAGSGAQNIEELTFIQRYWSPIMSIATEKIHLSEEMIDFNNQRAAQKQRLGDKVLDKLVLGEDLTNSERTPFKIFWNERPELKKHFSNAISDTIMLFSQNYGPDGNNPYFKSLLEYAQSIKPNREARELEHIKIQSEYDQMAKTLEQESTSKKDVTIVQQSIEQIQENPKTYEYIIDGKTITTPFDIKAETIKAYEAEFSLVPRKLTNTYLAELDNLIADKKENFYLTTCYINEQTIPPNIQELMLDSNQMLEIGDEMINIMETKHNPLLESARISLLQYAQESGLITNEEIKQHANIDIINIRDLLHERIETGYAQRVATRDIQNLCNKYTTPLVLKEKIKLKHLLLEALKNYNPDLVGDRTTSMSKMLTLLSSGLNEHPEFNVYIKRILNDDNIIEKSGSSLRYLFQPKQNPILSSMVSDHALRNIIFLYPEESSIIMTFNKPKFFNLMADYPEDMRKILSISSRILSNTKQILK